MKPTLFLSLILLITWSAACSSQPTVTVTPPATVPTVELTSTPTEPPASATATAENTPTPQPTPTSENIQTIETGKTTRPKIHITALLDYNAHIIEVQETITYTNQIGIDLSELLLVIEPNRWPGAFQLQALNAADGTPLAYSLQAHRLTIALDPPLEAGGTLQLTLAYSLMIPPIPLEADRPVPFGYTVRQTNLVDWYAHIPPYRDGWLVHDPGFFGEHQVYETADFVVDLRLQNAPEGLIVAASGPGLPLGDDPHGGTRYQLQAGRSFALSASSQYQLIEETVTLPDGRALTVRHYGFPFVEAMAPQVVQAAAQSMQLYSQLFAAYPHDQISIVQADFLDGMEYDGLFFLSRGFYNSYAGQPDDYLIAITVHEAAHQWWFALVGNDQALEPWLDEALCTYSEALFYENVHPEALDLWRARRVDFYAPSGWVGQPIYAYESFRHYRDAVYLNGMLFLESLRGRVGDDAFFAFLHDYTRQRAEQIATADDFFTILAAHSSADISDLVSEFFGP